MWQSPRRPGAPFRLTGLRFGKTFLVGGKQVFAARVNLPAVTMPEQAYLRSSLSEIAEQIRAGLSEAVVEAIE